MKKKPKHGGPRPNSGRPIVPDDQKIRTPARQLGRVSDEDWAILQYAAATAGQSFTDWATTTLLRAAKRVTNQGINMNVLKTWRELTDGSFEPTEYLTPEREHFIKTIAEEVAAQFSLTLVQDHLLKEVCAFPISRRDITDDDNQRIIALSHSHVKKLLETKRPWPVISYRPANIDEGPAVYAGFLLRFGFLTNATAPPTV